MGLAMLASVTAFLGVLLIVTAVLQERLGFSAARRRLEALAAYASPEERRSVDPALRRRSGAWAERTRADLERAGLALKLHEYLALRLVFALLGFLLVVLAGGAHPLAFLIGIPAAGIGFMLPALYVRVRMAREISKFNAQLEPMITMVSNSLRAGFGLLQSLDLAAEQLQPPMSTELRRLLREVRMGATLDDVLEAMSQRVNSYDLDVIVTAIHIQRSVGSNLSEVLDKVAHTIRERVRIQGEIATLTAQKRLSAWIVGLLPAAFILMVMALNFEYMEPLFTTGVGRLLLFIALGLNLSGILIMRRMVSSVEI